MGGREKERRDMSRKSQWRNSYHSEVGSEDSKLLHADKSGDSTMRFAAGGSTLIPCGHLSRWRCA